MRQDVIGGLIFFALSLAYGYSAISIPSLPGEALEPISPRTLPYGLSIMGVLLSVLLIIKSGIAPQHRILEASFAPSWRSYDWKLTLSLLALMLVYGLLLGPLGFILATWLFLAVGYWLMGERRIKMLLLASVPLVLVFWLLLTQVLGVYLETGSLWG